MASDNDKTSVNHNLDGSLKSNKKQGTAIYKGDGEKTNLQPVGKGGRHLSVPFDSSTANGDISERSRGRQAGGARPAAVAVLRTHAYPQ
ncbi:unnamed protein product [Colias eurytheme]|nr:unnamed protein product [Colias eurytheme]